MNDAMVTQILTVTYRFCTFHLHLKSFHCVTSLQDINTGHLMLLERMTDKQWQTLPFDHKCLVFPI